MPTATSLFGSSRGAVLVSTCALALLVPRIADACGASIPELTASVPVDGGTYPGNAALLFSGFEISLDAVTVTVDGAAATLVPAEFAASFATIAALVEPAPEAGQTVVVAGSFCSEGEGCDPVTITYTASAADVTAPVPNVDDTFFAVYDHPEYDTNLGCDELVVQQTLYVHLSQAAPAAGDALSLFQVEWKPEGAGQAGFRRAVRFGEEALSLAVLMQESMIGGLDLASACIDITPIDAANNAAPAFQVCPACFFRKDEVPAAGGPPEPEWSDDDAVPGSACAPAAPTTGDDPTGEPPSGTGTGTGSDSDTGSDTGSGTGDADSATAAEGDDGLDKGCACSSGGAAPSDLGRFVLFALGLGLAVVRRRPMKSHLV